MGIQARVAAACWGRALLVHAITARGVSYRVDRVGGGAVVRVRPFIVLPPLPLAQSCCLLRVGHACPVS